MPPSKTLKHVPQAHLQSLFVSALNTARKKKIKILTVTPELSGVLASPLAASMLGLGPHLPVGTLARRQGACGLLQGGQALPGHQNLHQSPHLIG